MHYPYQEETGGDLRMRYHITGNPREALRAAIEVIILAKDVLHPLKYTEAERIAEGLLGTKRQKQTARRTLMALVQPPPKRPIYYTQEEIQFLPRWT